MQRAFKILRAPGARQEIEGAAPTQVVPSSVSGDKEKNVEDSVENVNTYKVLAKPRLLDRWLDKVVEVSGSEFVYFTIIVALLIWAFLGILFGRSNTW
jgi:low-affinity ferrous iron transport protein